LNHKFEFFFVFLKKISNSSNSNNNNNRHSSNYSEPDASNKTSSSSSNKKKSSRPEKTDYTFMPYADSSTSNEIIPQSSNYTEKSYVIGDMQKF